MKLHSLNSLSPSQVFARILNSWVAPILASHGWGRKKQSFFKKQGDSWGIINFQKSSKTSKDEIVFTINLAVISGTLQKFFSARTIESPNLTDSHWRCRIGALLAENLDKWWVISNATSLEELKNELSSCLTHVAVPQVEKYLEDSALRDIWLKEYSPGLTEFQRLRYLSVLLKTVGPIDSLQLTLQRLKQLSETDSDPSSFTAFQDKIDRISL
ncbi:MAG: DUF4304 domain-containing protein [Acidobacteria bacterium]|nr:DUF4304 domain-containing protein [Acidobacteriota bacterium]